MSTGDDFDTTLLLGAVDSLDQMRSTLNGGHGSPPPQVRDDLLKLHQLAMSVYNDGRAGKATEMFDLALQLQTSVEEMMAALDQVQGALSQLVAGQPDDASDDDED